MIYDMHMVCIPLVSSSIHPFLCSPTSLLTIIFILGSVVGSFYILIQIFSIAYVNTLFSQGSIVGGFLAQPASKYSLLQVPFFCMFPYLLPCLVGAAIGVLSLIGESYRGHILYERCP